jgi:glycosyltransferase involved in cell wall biosynthesis
MMPEVSIIIPTYNYGRFISKAIDSVLSQTGVSCEVIVVDDGSTDDTPSVLASYDDKLRAFRQTHHGAPAARNLGLQKARGKYVLFLDADDWLLPGALSSRHNYLESQSDCNWVYGPWQQQDEHGRDITTAYNHRPFAFMRKRSGNILGYLLLGELIALCSVMISRYLVLEVGGFDINLPCFQDYELWLRVAARSPLGYIEDSNIVVLTHEGSISRSEGNGYQTLLHILQTAETRYPDTTNGLGRAWQRRLAFVLAERGRVLVKQGHITSGRNLLCEAIRRDPWRPRHYIGLVKSYQ